MRFTFSLQTFTMKNVSWVICIPLIFGIFHYKVLAEEPNSPKAVRIVTPVNHSFHLELDELKLILENDNIKDRQISVVSIAGAYRQGKSFLVNFFVKYLNAQVISLIDFKMLYLVKRKCSILI